MTDDGLEKLVRELLHSRRFFEIAARSHAQWLKYTESNYSRGPGGRHPALRAAQKTQVTIEQVGSEAALHPRVDQFVYWAERWQQMTDTDVVRWRPYLRYSCTCLPDSRTNHIEKHSLIFPVHHSFWSVWYPPNGLNCLCAVSSVSAWECRRDGLKVSEVCSFDYELPDEGFDFNIAELVKDLLL